MMGGDAGVKSKINHGSEFWFSVTFKTTEDENILENNVIPTDQLQNILKAASKLNTLIIDDEFFNAANTEILLQDVGISSQSVATGMQAIELINNNVYDIILLDMNLSDMTGLDVVKEIKKHPRNNNTELIMITGETSQEIRERCLQAGVNHYLVKPLNSSVFYETLISIQKAKDLHG